jgi:hypothetical protein
LLAIVETNHNNHFKRTMGNIAHTRIAKEE